MKGQRIMVAGMADPEAKARLWAALEPRKPDAWAASAADALATIGRLQPDVVIADAILPGMDAMALARAALSLKLNRYPDFIVLRLPGVPLSGTEDARALGVVFAEKPVSARNIADGLEALAGGNRPLPPEKAARLDQLLDALGVPDHPGRTCLFRAITRTWLDRRRVYRLRNELYAPIGSVLNMSVAQVDRAMRHAIGAAWRTGAIEHQNRIFGDTIDARRGTPTCGEMIAQLADILRWEG